MPQMSPLLWLNLFIYFIILMSVTMSVIYFVMIFNFKEENPKNSMSLIFNKYSLKW